MKATGIVRRIDDLGRVVIPKEIRRTMRIKEGDPLEIYTDRDGEVIFKKYSPVGELGSFAAKYAESLNKTCLSPVAICDRDTIIACSGISRKDYFEARVTPECERLIEERKTYKYESGVQIKLIESDETNKIAVLCPIITEGDIAGAVVILSAPGEKPGDTELKLTQVAASFISKHMEN